MNRRLLPALLPALLLAATAPAPAQDAADPRDAAASLPLLEPVAVRALAAEVSGDRAQRTIETIALHHRTRGSRPYRAAAEAIAERLRAYGLAGVELLRFPADGEVFYGTQRSRPPWDADFAELWEVRPGGDVLVASWEAMPMRLAQDSTSGSVTAELVDVGAGTREADYAGRDVGGKLVLTSSQPGAIADLAVGRFGAAGILSWAQNQRSAWWGENEALVRWGHLETFSAHPTFAFMLSPAEARAYQRRLAAGEVVRLRAEVRAGTSPGAYEVLTATIPGETDAEIAYSCHLDHPRPGANDNASGCAAILEVARTLAALVADGRLPPPRRTLRFVWPPEIEGTMAFLTARPDVARRLVAAIHLDMVGGGPETEAVFHVSDGPATLPSFVGDLGHAVGRWVNGETQAYADTGSAAFPLVESTGTKAALRAELDGFSLGSDHQVYADGSFGIPVLYLHDWPDRYIHTTWDTPGRIDPTKLRRAAFIAAATGWALANLEADEVPQVLDLVEQGALRRAADVLARGTTLDPAEAAHLGRFHLTSEAARLRSVARFAPLDAAAEARVERFLADLERLVGTPPPRPADEGTAAVVYARVPELRGPVSVFGYDYLEDHFGAEATSALALLRLDRGGDYAYSALNLVDGRRTIGEIRDALAAIHGPVPLDAVTEYLRALAAAGVVREVGPTDRGEP